MLEKNPALSRARTTLKAKGLINSFVLANLCDVLLTGIGVGGLKFMEIGPVAGIMLAQQQVIPLLIVKTAITAFMIGIFALSVSRNSRWAHPIRASLRIGNVILWLVVAWNELNIAVALTYLI
jgi:hypothetical protein